MKKNNKIKTRRVRRESPRQRQARRRRLAVKIAAVVGWGLAFGMFLSIWAASNMHEKQIEDEQNYILKYYEEDGPQVEVGDGYSIPYKDYSKFCQDREDAWNE